VYEKDFATFGFLMQANRERQKKAAKRGIMAAPLPTTPHAADEVVTRPSMLFTMEFCCMHTHRHTQTHTHIHTYTHAHTHARTAPKQLAVEKRRKMQDFSKNVPKPKVSIYHWTYISSPQFALEYTVPIALCANSGKNKSRGWAHRKSSQEVARWGRRTLHHDNQKPKPSKGGEATHEQ
jgi:hypothetical protein